MIEEGIKYQAKASTVVFKMIFLAFKRNAYEMGAELCVCSASCTHIRAFTELHPTLRVLRSSLYFAVGEGQPLHASKHGGDNIRKEHSEHTTGNTIELIARGQTRDRKTNQNKSVLAECLAYSKYSGHYLLTA